MTEEILTTFDEQGNRTGTAPRDEVHRHGLWHETFHCWFVRQADNGLMIYLQLRSRHKRDYAGLLDITAAGHLLADETVEDGVREVQEELGLELAFDELKPLGIIPYQMDTAGFMDRERANVFVYENNYALSDFSAAGRGSRDRPGPLHRVPQLHRWSWQHSTCARLPGNR